MYPSFHFCIFHLRVLTLMLLARFKDNSDIKNNYAKTMIMKRCSNLVQGLEPVDDA